MTEATDNQKVKPVSRKGSYTIAALCVIGLVGWMLSGMLNKEPEVLEEKKRVEATQQLPEVQVRRFGLQAYRPILSLSGKTVASRAIFVRAETAAQVTSLKIAEGDLVKKGQLLLQLNPGDTLARIEQAKAQVEREQIFYESRIKLLEKGLSSQLEKADAKSKLASAKVQLQSARENYRKTRITAPFAGWVVSQHVEVGDYVSAGTQLVELADVTPLQVRAFVTEQELAKIGRSSPSAHVTLATGEQYQGKLSYISPVANSGEKTFRIDVDLIDVQETVKIGVSVTVDLLLEEIEAIRISPSVLVLNDDGKLGIKYIDQDDTVAESLIQLVKVASDGAWITGNDIHTKEIIVTGQGFVHEGEQVIAKPVILSTAQE